MPEINNKSTESDNLRLLKKALESYEPKSIAAHLNKVSPGM